MTAEQRRLYECGKNPGHPTFTPFKDFTVNHLPQECQNEHVFNYIKFWARLTAKAVIKSVSDNRPETFPGTSNPYPYAEHRGCNISKRFSTGTIDVSRCRQVTSPCPCPICKELESPEYNSYWTFIVLTSTFMVFDDFEASCSRFECFYFDEEAQDTKFLYGLKLLPSLYKGYKLQTDRCQVLCVTHDVDLVDRLLGFMRNPPRMKSLYNTNVGVMLSYPHGTSLRITVGRILHVNVAISEMNPVNTPIKFGTGSKYSLPDSHQYLDQGDNSFLQLQPGTHKLPEDMTFSLPKDARYFHRYIFLDWPWFTFPPRTEFKLSSGESVYVPPDTKFQRHKIGLPLLYVTYDIDSCPGCAGASLLMDWGGCPLGAFRHFGFDRFLEANFSGSQFLVY